MKNYIEEFRKKHFSVQLHLFNYTKAYDSICLNKCYSQKIQSVKDFSDCQEFAHRHDCNLFTTENPEGLGMIAVIKQRNKENYLFAKLLYRVNNDVLETLICVN
jgi:hypothetical protein